MTASGASVTCLWVCVALCAVTGRSEVFYKKSGDGVNMDCTNADVTRDIEWKHGKDLIVKITGKTGVLSKGSTALARKAKLNGIKLLISSVEVSHSGTYTCTGHDATKKFTLHHSLHVMSVSVSPSDTVLSSTDVTLRCDVGGESKAQVQWMKPPGDEPYKSPGNIITLKSVTSDDAGQWTCVVKDEKGEVLGAIEKTLSVTGPLSSPNEVTAPPGGDVELPCSLPSPSGLHIVAGGWTSNSPSDLQFPGLTRDPSGLRWNGNKFRFAFSDEQLSTNFTVTLKNVQLSDAGEYFCNLTFKDGKSLTAKLTLKVGEGMVNEKVTVAPGNQEITAPLGGTADLPCTHSGSSSARIVEGQWVRVPPTDFRLPMLKISGAEGLQWNGTDVLKAEVTTSDQQPSQFNIKVNNVEHGDAGMYVCTLMFEDGTNWNTTVRLKVEEGGIVAPDARPSDSIQFWQKPVLLGLALWIWITVAAGSLLLIVLVVVIASVQCRKQRKRKAKQKKIKTENVYIRESMPMQEELPKKKSERRPRPGMKERPLPPVPRHQYKAMNRQ